MNEENNPLLPLREKLDAAMDAKGFSETIKQSLRALYVIEVGMLTLEGRLCGAVSDVNALVLKNICQTTKAAGRDAMIATLRAQQVPITTHLDVIDVLSQALEEFAIAVTKLTDVGAMADGALRKAAQGGSNAS